MRVAISRAAQRIAPPLIWDAYLRVRNLGRSRPWLYFRTMATCADTTALFRGKFAEMHDRYHKLSPLQGDSYRYLDYNSCFFANLCRNIPGDFVCAGVAFGGTAKIVYEFVDFPTLGKKFHLIDPFDATADSGRASANYHTDPNYVLRQYPPGAPIILHRERIPLHLPGPLSFVMTDTGVPDAAADSLPDFYDALSPGGIIVCYEFNRNSKRFESVLASLGITPFWLPSGQCVVFKTCLLPR
jgi:hypothetical protein